MQTKKVKVPKNIYNWFLCREHCSLTEIVHSVENILHNKEDYSYDATARDVCDWVEEQEDMITTLFYMKKYGVVIEDEILVGRNSIKGYKLESCALHSYYQSVEHDSFSVDKVAYYDLQIVIPNKPITICNLTYGEAEELVEFIQEALKVETDTTQVTWRELVDIVNNLCYETYATVLSGLLYKDALTIYPVGGTSVITAFKNKHGEVVVSENYGSQFLGTLERFRRVLEDRFGYADSIMQEYKDAVEYIMKFFHLDD